MDRRIEKTRKAIQEAYFRLIMNSKLKKITIKSTTIKSVGANAISGIDKKAVIKSNKKCVKAYKKLFTKKTGFKKTMKIK